jgi:hypothetical protein
VEECDQTDAKQRPGNRKTSPPDEPVGAGRSAQHSSECIHRLRLRSTRASTSFADADRLVRGPRTGLGVENTRLHDPSRASGALIRRLRVRLSPPGARPCQTTLLRLEQSVYFRQEGAGRVRPELVCPGGHHASEITLDEVGVDVENDRGYAMSELARGSLSPVTHPTCSSTKRKSLRSHSKERLLSEVLLGDRGPVESRRKSLFSPAQLKPS